MIEGGEVVSPSTAVAVVMSSSTALLFLPSHVHQIYPQQAKDRQSLIREKWIKRGRKGIETGAGEGDAEGGVENDGTYSNSRVLSPAFLNKIVKEYFERTRMRSECECDLNALSGMSIKYNRFQNELSVQHSHAKRFLILPSTPTNSLIPLPRILILINQPLPQHLHRRLHLVLPLRRHPIFIGSVDMGPVEESADNVDACAKWSSIEREKPAMGAEASRWRSE
jgi:hypothetical protein